MLIIRVGFSHKRDPKTFCAKSSHLSLGAEQILEATSKTTIVKIR